MQVNNPKEVLKNWRLLIKPYEKPNTKKAIIQLAPVLKDNPDILINVEGHTDSDGSTSANWEV